MAFDPRRDTFNDEDFALPEGFKLLDFSQQLEDLLESEEFLTNRLKSDFRRRYSALRRREGTVRKEVEPLARKLEAGILSEPEELQLYAALNDLFRIRLDIVDTQNALTLLELDNVTFPPEKYVEDGFTAVIDQREQHK